MPAKSETDYSRDIIMLSDCAHAHVCIKGLMLFCLQFLNLH